MSLLTSDDSRKASQLIGQVVKYSGLLSLLSYLAGLAYLGLLVHQPDKTYFSDNALLPGLATREFAHSALTRHYLAALENATREGDQVPLALLRSLFAQTGLVAHEQAFRAEYPLGRDRPALAGTNLFAVLRAPRAPSTEAIVISAPFRPHSTLPSIALMLSLANFFATKNYWAKDVIFLVADKELLGVQAWLSAYHGLDGGSVQSGPLAATSGVIQAALNLELLSLSPHSVQLVVEGLNGQLANLDLFNVAVELCAREGIPATFHGDSFALSADHWADWRRNARTLLAMMATQASTRPTGAHGLFQKFAIQSVSLTSPPGQSGQSASPAVGRAIEGIVRCVNNMLERFHRSYYFYLLTSTRRYISIGFYMIAFALLALPLPLAALSLYLDACGAQGHPRNLWLALQPAFLAHLSGMSLLSLVPLLRLCPLRTHPLELHDLAFGLLAGVTLLSLLPYGLLRRPKSPFSAHLQHMVALLNCLLLLASLALVNISLALWLTLLYAPLALLALWPSRLPRTALLLPLHPLALHYLCTLAKWRLEEPSLSLAHLASHSFLAQRRSLVELVEEWYLYDNWSFPLFSLFLYPVWLQFWYCSLSRVTSQTQ